MTPRELQTLRFIESFIAEHTYSPSFEEIRVGIGAASKSRVSQLVFSLCEQGRITMRTGRDRSIRVCGTSVDLSVVPTFLLIAEVEARKAAVAEGARA